MLEATLVHAKPADVLKRQPFVPKKEPPKTTGMFCTCVCMNVWSCVGVCLFYVHWQMFFVICLGRGGRLVISIHVCPIICLINVCYCSTVALAPLNVELSSTRRAEERKEYELRKREQQAETEKLEAELRRRQEEEERRELIRQRQETIIKPAPIKHYKPLQIKLSEKALTQPRSPAFSKR